MGVSVTLEWLGLSYLLVGLLHRSTITVMLEYYQRDLVLDQERHLDRLLDQIWRSKMLEFYLILKPENL